MTRLPKWCNPERRTELLDLFVESKGLCVFGHTQCLEPSHHYEYYIDKLIANWKLDDREASIVEWQAERRAIHSLGEAKYRAGRFGSIGLDIFHDSQPLFYIEALGMSGVRLKPFANVKLPSSLLELQVDLGDSLKRTSKNRRRKALRYNKPLPQSVEAEVYRLVSIAVRDYLEH